MVALLIDHNCHQNGYIFKLTTPVVTQIDFIDIDIWIMHILQRTVAPILNIDIRFLMVEGDTLVPRRASVISFTCQTDTLARYISIGASSTLLSRRRYRSMITVSREIPLSLGILRVTSPEVVVRFLL